MTLAGTLEGARAMTPLLLGLLVFAMAYGAAAAQKGLSLGEATLFSGAVFAGLAQIAALEAWSDHFTAGGLVAIGFVTFAVNLRHVLMAAALRPWLGPLPAWQSYPSLLVLADNNWVLAMRYHSQGGMDGGYLLGAGLASWVIWVGGTLAGHLIGGGIPDPKVFGLDMVVPAFYIAMLVPSWQGRRHTIAWAVAAAASVTAAFLLPGWWFIVIGAMAGAIAGGFSD